MTIQQLDEIIIHSEPAACAGRFAGVSEIERRELAGRPLVWVAELWARLQELDKAGIYSLIPTVIPKALLSKARTAGRTALPMSAGLDEETANAIFDTAAVAVLATATLTELKQIGWRVRVNDELTARIMTDRKPAWRHDWAVWVCQEHRRWRLLRRLVRDGMCNRPDHDNYTLLMIEALSRRGRAAAERDSSLVEQLRADRELLDAEIWRLFEIEGGGDLSLAAIDKYSPENDTWSHSLAELARCGELSRDRLLDASLDALRRDFAQFRAGWFSRFHETMEPTIEERAARGGAYLSLLDSRIPPTVSFALAALEELEKAGRLDPARVLDGVGPALQARAGGTVKSALRLLSNAVQKNPALRPAAALQASVALLHEASDVQAQAMAFIERFGQPQDVALRGLLNDRLSSVVASLRKRLAAWVGEAEPTAKPAGAGDAEGPDLPQQAASLDPRWSKLAGVPEALAASESPGKAVPALSLPLLAIPRTNAHTAITPIGNLDELIDAFAAVLESPDSVDHIERVLDGVSRLCNQRPDDFEQRIGPLRKRSAALARRHAWAPFAGEGPGADLANLAVAWTTGKVPVVPAQDPSPHRGKHPVTVLAFLARRVQQLAARAAASLAGPMLSAPTHSGAWIAPSVLVERCRECQASGFEPDIYDQVQSLLRLAPEGREEALARTRGLAGEFADALRYALGGKAHIGPTAALWVAAARSRAPDADDKQVEVRHGGLGPDAGTAAQYTPGLRRMEKWRPCGESVPRTPHDYTYYLEISRTPSKPKTPDIRFPTCLLHCGLAGLEGVDVAGVRWCASVWPIHRESYFAAGAVALSNNLDWWEAHWEQAGYLEPLFEPDTDLGPMARLLMLIGLSAKEPGLRGLATDALIACIDDGRLDGALLGGTLGWLMSRRMGVLARWAESLRIAAAVSPLHCHTIALALQRALADAPEDPPKDLHAILGLLCELLAELGGGVDVEAARRYLASRKGGGKTGGLVKTLLALKHAPERRVLESAATRALAGRIARARRWQGEQG